MAKTKKVSKPVNRKKNLENIQVKLDEIDKELVKIEKELTKTGKGRLDSIIIEEDLERAEHTYAPPLPKELSEEPPGYYSKFVARYRQTLGLPPKKRH